MKQLLRPCLGWVAALRALAPHLLAPPAYNMERARDDYRYLASDTSMVRPDLFDPVIVCPTQRLRLQLPEFGGRNPVAIPAHY
jgi:hypothetical protein